MKKVFLTVLLSCGLALASAQEETYQVPGFPPFAPAPKMLEVIEDRGDTVVVRHLMGETEIPKNPQRVFTDGSALQPMLALGVKPVGSNFTYTPADTPPRLAERLEGITLLERAITNLEAVLALEPDVIIAWDVIIQSTDGQTLYRQLSAIAPTIVLAENPHTFWEAAIRDLGEVFGLTGGVDKAFQSYQQEADALCERIHQAVGDGTFSILNINPREVALFGAGYDTTINNVAESSAGYIPYGPTVWAYKTCRLTPGPEIERLVGVEGAVDISLEILPELEADHLVVLVRSGGQETYDEFSNSPLWQRIPAVQQGNVYVFNGLLSASGPYASLSALEWAADLITGESE